MRSPIRFLFIVLCVVISAGAASAQPVDQSSEKISNDVRSFRALLIPKISPAVRLWIGSQSRIVLASKATSEEIVATIRSAIRTRFKGQRISADDEEILVALILAGAMNDSYDAAQLQRQKLKQSKDAISEMGQQDMLLLQQMMDKKTQLESMISDTMNSASENSTTTISALK